MNDAVVQLFDELCAEAKFPADVTAEHASALRQDVGAVWAQAQDSVDWNGLMAAMTPQEAADVLKSLLREQVRSMMAAEGLLPN